MGRNFIRQSGVRKQVSGISDTGTTKCQTTETDYRIQTRNCQPTEADTLIQNSRLLHERNRYLDQLQRSVKQPKQVRFRYYIQHAANGRDWQVGGFKFWILSALQFVVGMADLTRKCNRHVLPSG